MDISRLNTGEKLAGIAGIALLLIMFFFDWYSVDVGGGFADIDAGGNAWDWFGFIDIILFIAALSGITLAVTAGSQTDVDLPVALSAITAGLGALGLVLVLFRIISPPDGGLGDLVDVSRSIGVFLGLIAVGGVAAGGWLAMQEEGASFGGTTGGDPAPPPPPPPTAPPPGGPAA